MTGRTKVVFGITAVLLAPVVAYAVALNFPTRIALGPCLKDWTSPSSFSPRASKLETEDITLGSETVRVCFGRPSARDRVVFGNLVAYDRLWRAGANEPTRLFTGIPLDIGGVHLEPGRYSLYVRPTEADWDVFFSTSTFHWGNDLGPKVRAREVGSLTAAVEPLESHVETFTIRGEPAGDDALLVFEWERTRVAIPIRRGTTQP